jgi:hypothetical protein
MLYEHMFLEVGREEQEKPLIVGYVSEFFKDFIEYAVEVFREGRDVHMVELELFAGIVPGELQQINKR